MKYFKIFIFSFLSLFFVCSFVSADCVRGNYAFSTSLTPSGDTFLNRNTTNYDTNASLYLYTWPADTPANVILLQFDLSSIPANAVIQSADLQLYQYGYTGDSTFDATSHQIINVLPVTSGATGATYDGSNAWTPYGGWTYPLANGDIDTASDSAALNTSNGYKSWDVASIIQNWLDDPSSNYGILINGDFGSSVDSSRNFRSKDYGTSSEWPKLDLTYTIR